VAANQEEAPLVFHALQEPLHQALAETTPPPVANEELSWPTFVCVVVYYFVAGLKSGRLLLTHLRHAPAELALPPALKRATFFEAFRRFCPGQARQLFATLLARLAFFPVPEMAALGLLCAVDGSHWPALFRMHWALAGPHKPTVLLHLAFALNQMIPVAMLLTESTFSERKALQQMVQAGVTYVADRGYFAYYLLLDIAAAGAFFVIRAPCSVTYEVLEVLPVQLPSGVPWLLEVQDLKVQCDKGADGQDRGTWRVVRFVIGGSEFILFSNRWALTTWQIIIIYAYRWQIELLFLFVKRTLPGLHLLSHSKGGLQIQFYLLLTTALLLLHFKQRNEQSAGKEPGKGAAEPTARPTEKQDDASEPPGPGETAPAQPKKEPEPTVSAAAPGQPEQVAQAAPEAVTALAFAADPETKSAETPGAKPTARQPELDTPTEKTASQSQRTSGEKGARQGTVQPGDNSRWYHGLGEKMATFWRIGRHWLEVLRLNLARPWNPAVFQILPGSL
jgi:hypothetical protein